MAAKLLDSGALSALCGSVATMLSAGLQIDEAVHLLAENREVALQDGMRRHVPRPHRGQSLSQSMETTNAFPGHVIDMVQTGEQSGRLESVLRTLEVYYGEEDRTFRRSAAPWPTPPRCSASWPSSSRRPSSSSSRVRQRLRVHVGLADRRLVEHGARVPSSSAGSPSSSPWPAPSSPSSSSPRAHPVRARTRPRDLRTHRARARPCTSSRSRASPRRSPPTSPPASPPRRPCQALETVRHSRLRARLEYALEAMEDLEGTRAVCPRRSPRPTSLTRSTRTCSPPARTPVRSTTCSRTCRSCSSTTRRPSSTVRSIASSPCSPHCSPSRSAARSSRSCSRSSASWDRLDRHRRVPRTQHIQIRRRRIRRIRRAARRGGHRVARLGDWRVQHAAREQSAASIRSTVWRAPAVLCHRGLYPASISISRTSTVWRSTATTTPSTTSGLPITYPHGDGGGTMRQNNMDIVSAMATIRNDKHAGRQRNLFVGILMLVILGILLIARHGRHRLPARRLRADAGQRGPPRHVVPREQRPLHRRNEAPYGSARVRGNSLVLMEYLPNGTTRRECCLYKGQHCPGNTPSRAPRTTPGKAVKLSKSSKFDLAYRNGLLTIVTDRGQDGHRPARHARSS